MHNPIACRLMTPLNRVRVSLRRYSSHACKGPLGYHQALRHFKDVDEKMTGFMRTVTPMLPSFDDRWPVDCDACPFVFTDDINTARRQMFQEWLFADALGDVFTISEFPIGAMWYTPWSSGGNGDSDFYLALEHAERVKGHLLVKTPGGDWDIDRPSVNGAGWMRTGEPPLITVSPSFDAVGEWHGHLVNGHLVAVS